MNKLITTVALLLASVVLAGDDYVTTVAYTGTAACTSALRPKTNYAVQCTTDCRVSVTESTATPATANSVKVLADALYDIPTTARQLYICVIQDASAGDARIYHHRDLYQ